VASDARAPLPLAEAVLAARDGDAGDKPLHVPLERAGAGLVEVVAVEDETPVRSGEDPEVREVGVATELHGELGARRPRQIGGHHRCGPPEEGEGRGKHPAVANWHQLGHAALVLRPEDRERITPGSAQLGVAGARPLAPCRFAFGRLLGGVITRGLDRHTAESPTFPL
jgi:hypothetical protein